MRSLAQRRSIGKGQLMLLVAPTNMANVSLKESPEIVRKCNRKFWSLERLSRVIKSNRTRDVAADGFIDVPCPTCGRKCRVKSFGRESPNCDSIRLFRGQLEIGLIDCPRFDFKFLRGTAKFIGDSRFWCAAETACV